MTVSTDQKPDAPPALRSRRTLSLTFNIPIAKTNRFWQALGEGKFMTTRCSRCGKMTFPPQADCPACMGGDPEWVELGTEAELLTFTCVQVTPTSFVENDPYIVAIGRLPAEGLNVLAWLEGGDLSTLKPGAKLRIETRRAAANGSSYYVFVLSD
jgi:uncharacterized protein